MRIFGPFLFFVSLANGLFASIIYVDDDASSGGDGSSWAVAVPTIQEAVELAMAGDEIWVAEGVYRPDTTTDSILIDKELFIYGGFDTTETLLTERNSDPNTNNTVISGKNGLGDDVSDNFETLVEVGLYGGVIDGFQLERAEEAAIELSFLQTPESHLIFRNCIFTSNTRAILAERVPTSLLVENCDFFSSRQSAVKATNSTYCERITYRNCLFQGNKGYQGGAIEGGSGLMENCRFLENEAEKEGGAIYASDVNLSQARNCVFSGNLSGEWGGAIYFERSYSTSSAMISCLFSGNRAEGRGGAIALLEDSAGVFANCTFASNFSRTAAAIEVRSRSYPRFYNCVVWGNETSSSGSSSFYTPSAWATSFYNCLVEGFSPSQLLDDSSDNLDGSLATNAPLFLFAPSAEDAPTISGNFAIGLGSPLLEQGTVTFDDPNVELEVADFLPSDLAGNPRFVGTIDIGAFEEAAPGLSSFGEFFPELNQSDDENGNGLSNFQEYAAGFDPRGRPAVASVVAEKSRFAFFLNPAAQDVEISVEASENLVGWSVLSEDVEYSSIPVNETVLQNEYEVPYSGFSPSNAMFLQVTYSEIVP